MLYKRIDDPQEGQAIQFLAVYATQWPWGCGVEPTTAFVEVEEDQTGNNRPNCPDCGAIMVKAHEQNEKGDWGVRWLCECESDRYIIAKED